MIKLLATGGCRKVYSTQDPNIVLKIIKQQPVYKDHNEIEYNNWLLVKDTQYSHFFVPCYYLSPDKSILIQQRGEPTDSPSDVGLPEFLKKDGDWVWGAGHQWVIINNKVKLCDYGKMAYEL
jgi:hypothetical protein